MTELNGLFLVILTELSADCKKQKQRTLDSYCSVILQSVMAMR